MNPITMEFEGIETVKANLAKHSLAWIDAAAAALYQMGLRVLAIAIRKTPVDTGRLRATNYCAPPEISAGAEMTVTLGFGTAYGIYVHERTDLKHTSGEAKFLQKALDEVAGGYLAELAARIKENAEHGIGVRAISSNGVPTSPDEASVPYAHHQAKKENAARNRITRSNALRKKGK